MEELVIVNRYAELVADSQAAGIRKVVVAAAIIQPDDHDVPFVLLLQRPDGDFMGGLWELPSGTVEAAEALDEALIREVQEETGLSLAAIGDYLGYFDYPSNSGQPTRQFTFSVTTRTHQPITLTEHSAFVWSPVDGSLPVSDEVKQQLLGSRSE